MDPPAGKVQENGPSHLDRLKKMREERIAREKERLNKLRALNMSKYSSGDTAAPIPDRRKTIFASRESMLPKPRESTIAPQKPAIVSVLMSKPSYLIANKCKPIASVKPTPSLVSVKKSSIPKPKSAPRAEHTNYINKNKHNIVVKKTTPFEPAKSDVPVKVVKRKPDMSTFDRLSKPKHIREPAVVKDVPVRRQSFAPRTMQGAGANFASQAGTNIRRSISAVHLKKINTSELKKCVHKKSRSVGQDLDTLDEESVEDTIYDKHLKSDRKKSVKFMTPILDRTPHTRELQQKLASWLKKRNKPLNSFHHLRCFGVDAIGNNLPIASPEDNKENEAVEKTQGDSNAETTAASTEDWRENSSFASANSSISEACGVEHCFTPSVGTKERLINGVLVDLRQLIQEGFDGEQCNRWLRAIRSAHPECVNTPEFWECRANLDAKRGDLQSAVKSWQNALRRGFEPAAADASLDQLLDKFMQLDIATKDTRVLHEQNHESREKKLLDVKNVFKSTLIKFAVKQSKSEDFEFKATPVRRSTRLSCSAPRLGTAQHQVCDTLSQLSEEVSKKTLFVSNRQLDFTP